MSTAETLSPEVEAKGAQGLDLWPVLSLEICGHLEHRHVFLISMYDKLCGNSPRITGEYPDLSLRPSPPATLTFSESLKGSKRSFSSTAASGSRDSARPC